MSKSILILSFSSLVFAIVVGSGFYGFGIDYHGLYSKPNIGYGNYRDYLGYRLSTLTLYDTHIGVFLLSLLLSLSNAFLINQFCKDKSINSIFFILVITQVVFHTWPVIMSATNAMRQGYASSLIFLGFVFIFKNKFKLATLFFILSIFMHKTGLLFFVIFLLTFLIKSILGILKNNFKIAFLFIIPLILLPLFYFLLIFFFDTSKSYRVINGDFRIPFLLINSLYIITYLIFYDLMKDKTINLFLFVFSIIAIPFLLVGFNWQYERLNMMMTIPYILSIGSLFNSRSAKIFWMIAFSVLLFLTFYQGMYASLVDEYTFKKIRGLL